MGRWSSGRRRIAVPMAIGTAMVTLASGCGALAEGETVETVVIGADLELTGAGAELGAIYHDALRLRVEQINQQQLLEGRRLELEVRDNRSDPGTSAINVGDLATESGAVAVVSGGCGACAVATAEVAVEQGLPVISLAAADEVVEPIDERRYTFKVAPNADQNAAALAEELLAADATTVGLLTTGDAYGEAGVRELTEAIDRAGLDLVVTAVVADDEAAVTEAVDQIMDYAPEPENPPPPPGQEELGQQVDQPTDPEPTGPDAVVVWLPPASAASVTIGLRDAGYEGRLLLDSIAAGELFLAGRVGAAYEGATLVFNESLVIDSVIATSPAKAARKTWFNTYSARYGNYHAFSVFAADALQLLVETINRLDTTDPDEIRDGLEQIQMDGLSGPIRITPTNHSALTALGVTSLVARGDRWQPGG